ncbi:peptidoglycan-binding domain-containing protein [Coleofasciculus sp. C1-SOL-03]|uniref:peptidoglycan-binding domain-containing protein n=1 Tax=Coleofasciculus sp. C1-SOL-03 TaxID=3069522 RepID=UPI0040629A23
MHPTRVSSPSATSASSLPSDDDFEIIAEHFNEHGYPYNLSENVRRIKEFLGLTPVDGNYGPTTAMTVYLWQQNNGLTADGEVGWNTWSKMFSGIEPYQLTESTPPIETSLPASAIEGLRFLLQSLPPEIKEKLGGEANYLPLVDYYTQLARIAFLLLQLTPEQGYTGWPNSFVPPADRQECNTDCSIPSPNEPFTVKWRVPMTNREEILEQLRILDRGRNPNNLPGDPNP